MTPRLIRRFSQAAGFGSGCGMINEEERIFGSLGEIVYNTTTREKEGSSLMIVHHEPSLSTIIPSPLLSTMRLLNTPDGGVAKTAAVAAV
jgi:hypothetical protein